MIFADKLIKLRKQAGLSQEQLAEKLDVTRQAISKWEGSISYPDIFNILKISQLFGVTSDFLLNDDINEMSLPNTIPCDKNEDNSCDKVNDIQIKGKEFSDEVLNSYKKSTLFCTISLSVFMLLTGIIWFALFVYNSIIDNKETSLYLVKIFIAAGITTVMFVAITIICIYDFIKLFRYKKTPFILDEETKEYLNEKNKKFSLIRKILIIAGTVLLLLSPLPFVLSTSFRNSEGAQSVFYFLGLIMYTASIDIFAVYIKIKKSFKDLLSERIKISTNRNAKVFAAITSIVWAFVITLYIVISTVLEDWNNLYFILIVGGLFSTIISIAMLYLICGIKEKN